MRTFGKILSLVIILVLSVSLIYTVYDINSLNNRINLKESQTWINQRVSADQQWRFQVPYAGFLQVDLSNVINITVSVIEYDVGAIGSFSLGYAKIISSTGTQISPVIITNSFQAFSGETSFFPVMPCNITITLSNQNTANNTVSLKVDYYF